MATPLDVVSPITIANYGREAWDNATNNVISLKLLKEKGNISSEDGGDSCKWPVDVGWYDVENPGDYEDVSDLYNPQELYTQPSLNWGEKAVLDGLSKGQLRRNRGDPALVKFVDQRIPKMFKSITSQSNGSIAHALLNSDGTDGALPFYGLPAVFNHSSTVANTVSDATSLLSGTYAGKSTAIGGLVSEVPGADNYAWTPRLYNSDFDWDGDSTADGGITASNVLKILSSAMIGVTFDGSDPEMQPDCGLMDKTSFGTLREKLGDKQTIYVTGAVGTGDVHGLGNNVQKAMHDGIPFYWDAHMPADTVYILNFDKIGLDYLKPLTGLSGDKYPGKKGGGHSEMFEIETTYNSDRRGLRVEITLAGQFKINPRFQAKIAKFTA